MRYIELTIKMLAHSLVGLSLYIFSANISAQWLYFSPWSGYLTGNLGLNYNLAKQKSSELTTSGGLVGNFKTQMVTNGFIYRPWILQANFLASTELDHNIYNILDQEQQTLSTSILGGNLHFYPETHYSTDLELEQRYRFNNGENSNRTVRSKVRLSNKYVPIHADYRLISSLQWIGDQASINQYSFNQYQAQSSFSKKTASGNYSININGSSQIAKVAASTLYNDQDKIDSLRTNTRQSNGINYNQQWQLSEQGSSSLLASYITEKNVQNDNQQRVIQGQFSSLTSIVSKKDSRLNFSLSMLVNTTEIDNIMVNNLDSELTTISSKNYSTNAGFYFDYSDTLRFTGALTAYHTINEQTKNTSFSQLLGVSYSDQTELGLGTNYGWFNNVSVLGRQNNSNNEQANTYSAKGGSFTVTPSIGHNISKDLIIWGQPLNVSATQDIRHKIIDKQQVKADSQWMLNQSASISWYQDIDATSSNLTMSLNDYRQLNGQSAEGQSLYISFQRGTQLSADSSWGGNLTYEWRSSVYDDGEESTNTNASGNMWYRARDLFGVPRLSFRSTIELPINELLFDDKERNNKVTSWQNRLDFRMGLLEATAQMDMTLDNYNISISVKRYLGMPL